MNILLDECLDRRFANDLPGHSVKTVPQMGWAGKKNGELLSLAEKDFDVFITVDKNLSYQQHLPRFKIAVLVLKARSNRLADLKLLAPEVLLILPSLQTGKVQTVGS